MRKNLFTLAWLVIAVLVASCQSLSQYNGPENADASASRELKVITSGGFTAAYDILAPQFEQQTGVTLVTAYGASSGGAPDSIPVRLERGGRSGRNHPLAIVLRQFD